jgi:hypothetical protein
LTVVSRAGFGVTLAKSSTWASVESVLRMLSRLSPRPWRPGTYSADPVAGSGILVPVERAAGLESHKDAASFYDYIVELDPTT